MDYLSVLMELIFLAHLLMKLSESGMLETKLCPEIDSKKHLVAMSKLIKNFSFVEGGQLMDYMLVVDLLIDVSISGTLPQEKSFRSWEVTLEQ